MLIPVLFVFDRDGLSILSFRLQMLLVEFRGTVKLYLIFCGLFNKREDLLRENFPFKIKMTLVKVYFRYY